MKTNSKVIYTAHHLSLYRFHFLSVQIKELIGFDANLFLDRQLSWLQQVHPDDQQYLVDHISKMSQGDTVILKYRFLNNEKQYLNIVDFINLEKDVHTHELTFVGILWLATTSEQAETDAPITKH